MLRCLNIEGAAGEERALVGDRACFDRVRRWPSVLTVVEPKLRTEVLGQSSGAPVAIVPMGCQAKLPVSRSPESGDRVPQDPA
ncbi:alpha-hydroxy-acid oxidizing protein [Streptomyces sp. 900105755]